MIAASWATLKLHRLETLLVVAAAGVLTAWAAYVLVQAASVAVPDGCFAAWVAAGGNPDASGSCGPAVLGWGRVLGGAGDLFREATEFAPFVLGALLGAPIVAGELEARTASMAWSLYPSRRRWLTHQVVPVLLVAGVAIAVLALTAEILRHQEEIWGGGFIDAQRIGTYGYGFVARVFGTFGIAVALGALFGRQLGGFLLTVALMLLFVNLLAPVRDGWYAAMPTHVMAEGDRGVVTGWAFLAPDGTYLSRQAAEASVPPDVLAQDVGSIQPTAASTWLTDRGYTQVYIGISGEVAMRWAPIEAATYVLAGLAGLGLSLVIVNRRRPR